MNKKVRVVRCGSNVLYLPALPVYRKDRGCHRGKPAALEKRGGGKGRGLHARYSKWHRRAIGRLIREHGGKDEAPEGLGTPSSWLD